MLDLISVIVPVYNMQAYLRRCIDSIMMQTYTELEIILVDDGSTDMSGRICDEYEGKDRRIKTIHRKNGGIASARNAGMEICRGKYLMFVDSDDYLSADAVELLLERLLHDQSDMVIARHTDVFEDGSQNDRYCRWMTDALLTKEEAYTAMGEENHYQASAWGKLYRRELFEGIYYPPLTCGEDLWVFPNILERCEKISIIGRSIYFYEHRQSSITHQKAERHTKDSIEAGLHIVRFFLDRDIRSAVKKWHKRCVDAAFDLARPIDALAQFSNYFDKKELKFLRKNASIKTRLKLLLLRHPVLCTAIRRCRGGV